MLMSTEEAMTMVHGDITTIRDGNLTHQCIQTNLADVICGGKYTKSLLKCLEDITIFQINIVYLFTLYKTFYYNNLSLETLQEMLATKFFTPELNEGQHPSQIEEVQTEGVHSEFGAPTGD